MAHGAPDYSNVRKGSFVQRLDDLAELAVRLGSPIQGDRAGEVVFLDDFSVGIGKIGFATYGSDASYNLSGTISFYGDYSVRLIAGSDGTHHTDLFKAISNFNIGKMGVAVFFRLTGEADYLAIQLNHHDGVYYNRYEIRFYPTTQRLGYMNSSGVFTLIDTLADIRVASPTFHYFKIVGDLAVNQFVRCIFDNTVFLLTDLECWSTTSATYPYLYGMFKFYGRDGENDQLHIDSFVITQNEY